MHVLSAARPDRRKKTSPAHPERAQQRPGRGGEREKRRGPLLEQRLPSLHCRLGLYDRVGRDPAENDGRNEGRGGEVGAAVEAARHFTRGVEPGNDVSEDVDHLHLAVDLDAAVGGEKHRRGGEDVEGRILDFLKGPEIAGEELASELGVVALFAHVAVVALDRFLHDLRIESGLLGGFLDRVALEDEAAFFGFEDRAVVAGGLERNLAGGLVIDAVTDAAFLLEHVVAHVLLRNRFVDEALSRLVDDDPALPVGVVRVVDRVRIGVEGEGRLDVGHVDHVRPVGERHLEAVPVAALAADREGLGHAGDVLREEFLVAREAARSEDHALLCAEGDGLPVLFGENPDDPLRLFVVGEALGGGGDEELCAVLLGVVETGLQNAVGLDFDAAVRAHARKEKVGLKLSAESHEPFVDRQMIVDEGVHDVLVVEAPARFDDVLEEKFVRVLFTRLLLKVGAHDERAAPADGGGAAREGHLFENQHLEALFGRVRGRGETRAARSHDDHVVGFVEFDGTVRGERHRGRGGERGGTRERALQEIAAVGHGFSPLEVGTRSGGLADALRARRKRAGPQESHTSEKSVREMVWVVLLGCQALRIVPAAM